MSSVDWSPVIDGSSTDDSPATSDLSQLGARIGYVWWGHAVEYVGPRNVVWPNSHNDGGIMLSGRRGIPNEAYDVRVITSAGSRHE